MQNNLKWYLENIKINSTSGHQTVADNLLSELLQVEYKMKDTSIPKFTHVDINNIFYRVYTNKKMKIRFKEVLDHKEFFSYFLDVICKYALAAEPFQFQNNQIISWLVTRCSGKLLDRLNSEYDLNTTSETRTNSNGTEISLYDRVEFREYQTLKNESPYLIFLKEKGGLRKIIGSRDAEILELCFNKEHLDINQIEIGEKLSIDPKLVSSRFKKASKKIKKEYQVWKQISALKDCDTYYTIYNFLRFYNNVCESDQGDFDHYHFFIKFLKDFYKNGEQHISARELHKNKKMVTYTVFDVLSDGLKDRKLWTLLFNLLEYNQSEVTSTQKDKIVIWGVKVFNDFIKSSNRAIHKVGTAAFDKVEDTDSINE